MLARDHSLVKNRKSAKNIANTSFVQSKALSGKKKQKNYFLKPFLRPKILPYPLFTAIVLSTICKCEGDDRAFVERILCMPNPVSRRRTFKWA